jgi:hypothetical protein
MASGFERTVAALAETIMVERGGGIAAEARPPVEPVARYLLDTVALMPDYLRLPMRVLTLLFGASSILTGGRPFDRLPQDRRARQLAAWRGSALGFRRDLIKLYETLAIFALYSELYHQDYEHAGG